jgi:hypothetical protein
MEIPRSKTKNLKVYIYLLKYQTLKAAYENLEDIASHFKRHKNGIISCITQARRNPKIYSELIRNGYADSQIPPWFIRPQKEENDLEAPKEETHQASPATHETPQDTIEINNLTSIPENYGIKIIDMREIQQSQIWGQTPDEQIFDNRLTQFKAQQIEDQKREHKASQENRISMTENPTQVLSILREDSEWEKIWQQYTPTKRQRFNGMLTQLCRMKQEKRLNDEQNQQLEQAAKILAWGKYLGKW